MLRRTVIDFFGGQAKVARALGITRISVHKWKEVIPEGAAYKIESITRGQLKVDPSFYPAFRRQRKAS